MSEALEVSPDDPARVADAIERAARGDTVHLVRDGRRVADIVPTAPASGASSAGNPDRGADWGADCEAGPEEMAAREARVRSREPRDIQAGRDQAARFGAPTLQHYRDVYTAAGASWPGEAFVRRHYPVADAS